MPMPLLWSLEFFGWLSYKHAAPLALGNGMGRDETRQRLGLRWQRGKGLTPLSHGGEPSLAGQSKT